MGNREDHCDGELTLHDPLDVAPLQCVLHDEYLQCTQCRMDMRVVSGMSSKGAWTSAKPILLQAAIPTVGALTSLLVPALHDIVDHGVAVKSILLSHNAQSRQAPVHAVQAQVRREVVREVLFLILSAPCTNCGAHLVQALDILDMQRDVEGRNGRLACCLGHI